ncbi:MAG: FlgO family outer membrane protein [bacterium]
MKIKRFYCVTFLFLLFFSQISLPARSEESSTMTIGVATLRGDTQNGDVTETLTTDLGKSGNLNMVETSQLDKILREIKTGSILGKKDCQTLLNRTGATHLVMGNVKKEYGRITVNARLTDLKSAKIILTDNVNGAEQDEFFLVEQLAQRVCNKITKKFIVMESKLDLPQAGGGDAAISLWLDKGENPTYKNEDTMKIFFKADKDCYVTICNINTEGKVNLLFPNNFTRDNFVKAEQVYSIPDEDAPYDFQVEGKGGVEYIYALATDKPFGVATNFEELVKKEAFPELKSSPKSFSRDVRLKLKESGPWSSQKIKFFLAPK